MKRKNLVLLCIIALVVVIACKKDKAPSVVKSNSTQANNDLNKGVRKVPQKLYDISIEQTTEIIKKFKSLKKDKALQSKLVETDSLSLDSSVFVIEAALNFDFDMEFDQNYDSTIYDTLDIDISINNSNLKVKSNDLQTVYEQLQSNIVFGMGVNNRVKIIDVEAYLHDNNTNVASYKIGVIKYNTVYISPCSPFPNNNLPYANPSIALTYQALFICPNNKPESHTLMNQKLNCNYVPCPANVPYSYWSQVGTYPFEAFNGVAALPTDPTTYNPYPNALYCTDFKHTSWHCAAPNNYITGAALNSRLAACNTLAANLINTYPAGWKVSNKFITTNLLGMGINVPPDPWYVQTMHYSVWWNLYVTVGKRQCNSTKWQDPH